MKHSQLLILSLFLLLFGIISNSVANSAFAEIKPFQSIHQTNSKEAKRIVPPSHSDTDKQKENKKTRTTKDTNAANEAAMKLIEEANKKFKATKK